MKSISEEKGIRLLTDNDLSVLSLGISTAGVGEIEMARLNPNRHIIATTIDEKGLEYSKELVGNSGFANQIELKCEDVREPFCYADNSFDFVYSRLCLHYIDDQAMQNALKEIHRVLKPNKKAFIVLQTPKRKQENSVFIPETGMTKYTRGNKVRFRRFYTQETMRLAVENAGGVQDTLYERIYGAIMR